MLFGYKERKKGPFSDIALDLRSIIANMVRRIKEIVAARGGRAEGLLPPLAGAPGGL